MRKKTTRNERLRALLSFLDNDSYVIITLVIALLVLGVLGITVGFGISITVAVILVVLLLLLRIVIIPQLLTAETGREGMISLQGRVVKPLTPVGIVLVKGERWKARSDGGEISLDEYVEVVKIEKLMLTVRRLKKE